MTGVLVAGASRRVGFETVRALRALNHTVSCFFRAESEREKVEATGAHVQIVDAFDPEAVNTAVASAGSIRALICTLGGKPGDNPRIDFIGARNCIDAARRHGIDRFLFVTAIGCGETWDALEEKAKQFLGPAIAAKNEAENYLLTSGLAYTILRPGALTDDPATGHSILTQDLRVLGAVTRADVAAELVRCLESDRTVGQVYQVLDRDQIRTDVPFEVAEI